MKLMTKLTLGLSGIALALSGCSAQPMDDAVHSTSAQAAATTTDSAVVMLDRGDADPALWKIADSDTTIYLFGTMHALKPDVVWFDDAVRTAFDASDELVIEMLDPDSAEAQSVIKGAALRSDGTTLSSDLTAEQQARLATAAQSLGAPAAALDQMQPWFAAVNLTVIALGKLGYGAESGAETILKKAAKQRKMPVLGLETFEQQMGFFAGLPTADQIEFLMSGVDQIGEMENMFAELERAWGTGDVEATATLMQEGMDESPVLFETLLAGRNRAWAEWIDTRLDTPGTVFIAVGAGHLAGEKSVQDMLAARNLTATRISY